VEWATSGSSVSGAGDIDGDGLSDLAIGAALHEAAGTRAGRVYVWFGPVSGSHSLADAPCWFTAETESEDLGLRTDLAGDFNGDSYADLLVSAPRDPYYGDRYPGKVYLFPGPFTGELGLADVGLVMSGEFINDYAGYGLSYAGDIDGDGRSDVLVGAPYNDEIVRNGGKTYLVMGRDL